MSGSIWIKDRAPKPVIVNNRVAVTWSRPVDHRKGICTFSPRGRGKCALNQTTSSDKESGGTAVITNCSKKLSHSILREKFHGAGAKEVDGAASRKPEFRKPEPREYGQASATTPFGQQELIRKIESILGERVVLLYKGMFSENYAQCYNCFRINRDVVEFSACQCIPCGATFYVISPKNLELTMVKRNYRKGIDCPICYGYHLDVKLGIYECRRRKFVVY